MSLTCEITFTLNGRPRTTTVPARMSTLTMLREVEGLTGTKVGCNEGECGACTILVDGKSLNACLMFAVDCDDRDIYTIEGLGAGNDLDRLQKAFIEQGAVQCGFCIPGMVMQAHYLVKHQPDADREAIKRGIEGNLCRCTGYKKVVDAIASVVASTEEAPA